MRWKCWAVAACAGMVATGALAQGPGATPVAYRDQQAAPPKKAAQPPPAKTKAPQTEAALAPVAGGERKIRVIPLYNLPKPD